MPETFDIVFKRLYKKTTTKSISTLPTSAAFFIQPSIQSHTNQLLETISFLHYLKEILTLVLIFFALICLGFLIRLCIYPIVR